MKRCLVLAVLVAGVACGVGAAGWANLSRAAADGVTDAPITGAAATGAVGGILAGLAAAAALGLGKKSTGVTTQVDPASGAGDAPTILTDTK